MENVKASVSSVNKRYLGGNFPLDICFYLSNTISLCCFPKETKMI
ncbi:hypothetical protein HMPREF1870_00687 [Bacteroidales bacterium KA00344]|nr:hypothetical protein HMPREF1870_00687 [Bacteroidales bacterium KA00344]